MPKRLILAAILSFLAVANARSGECWTRTPTDVIPTPRGVQLEPNGYICVDHLGTYAQATGEREVVLPARGLPRSDGPRPRVQVRPSYRMTDLLSAGLAYPASAESYANASR